MTIKTLPNSVEVNADLQKRIKKLLAKAKRLEDLQLTFNNPTQKQEEVKSLVMKKNK